MTAFRIPDIPSPVCCSLQACNLAESSTIEEVPTIVVLAELPLTPPPNSDEPQSSCDVGCIGGVAGGCFVLLLVLVCTDRLAQWRLRQDRGWGPPPSNSKKLSDHATRRETAQPSACMRHERYYIKI